MKFLNNREDTIDFQLTSHGKYLLSKGKLKPVYYAFFDSDIIYDATFASALEDQNNIETRIKEVPQLEVQTVYAGIETNINKSIEYVRLSQKDKDGKFEDLKQDTFQPNIDKNYSLFAPIGTVSNNSIYAPAFNTIVYEGEITGAVNHIYGDFPLDKIPQIELDVVKYDIIEKQDPIDAGATTEEEIERDEEYREKGVLTSPMKDGSYIDIEKDYKLLYLEELNSFNDDKDFLIEVYEIKTDSNSSGCTETLIPLYFKQKKSNIVNDILIDVDDIEEEDFEIDESFVEYFFNIKVDNEIPEYIYCKLPEEKRPKYISCEKVPETMDIYRTDVKNKEDC